MTASQHIGRAVHALHAQLNANPQGHRATYVGQGFTITAAYDVRWNVRYTVRWSSRAAERGIGAVWAALTAEHAAIETAAAAALEAAAAEILGTYRTQGAAALSLGLPLAPITQTAVDRLTDAGHTRADASAQVDEVTDELVNDPELIGRAARALGPKPTPPTYEEQWAAAVAELPARAAPLDPVAQLRRAAALAQSARDEAQTAMWAAQGAAAMARDAYELAQGRFLDALGRYNAAVSAAAEVTNSSASSIHIQQEKIRL